MKWSAHLSFFFSCESTTQIKAVEHSHHCTKPFHASTQPIPILWCHLCGCLHQFFPSVHSYVSIIWHTMTYLFISPVLDTWVISVLAVKDKGDIYSSFSGVGEKVHAPGEESCWAREWVWQLFSYYTVFWVSTHFAVLCYMVMGWGLGKPRSCSATWLQVRFCEHRLLEGDCKAEGGRGEAPLPVSIPVTRLLHPCSKLLTSMTLNLNPIFRFPNTYKSRFVASHVWDTNIRQPGPLLFCTGLGSSPAVPSSELRGP